MGAGDTDVDSVSELADRLEEIAERQEVLHQWNIFLSILLVVLVLIEIYL